MNKRSKEILTKFKNPPVWVAVVIYVLTAVCGGGSIVLALLPELSPVLQVVSYALYGVSALLLAYAVYTIVIYAPRIKGGVITSLKKRELTRRLLEHYGFRTVVFAGVSLIINVAYVLFNGMVAIAERSIWYGALAAYHLLLTILRGGLVLYHRRKGKSFALVNDEAERKRVEITKYRTCGILLIFLPVCLSFAILQMVVAGTAFVRWDWTVFAFAAYAFYKIITSIINLVKAKKADDATVQALRNVSFADALVSILALQTSLLHAYGEGLNYGFANAATGGAVCAITVVTGIIMVLKANKQLKLDNKEK